MILAVKNIRKNFLQGETNIEVLKDINFSAEKGESLAIVGPSGSGKSTLLSLLAGLDTPSSGEILVQGSDITKMNEDQMTLFRAQHYGIVFQQFHLMPHLNAVENVSLPLEILGESNFEVRAKEVLEQVGLLNRQTHFPHQLSGGECQRVAIARALVVRPALLLADEPSGNLDTQTGSKVMQLFFDLISNSKTTTILVTHSAELASRCSRQLVMSDGLLQETKNKLSASPQLL